ncbi:uncharacterized protein LOC113515309 [Galleria mellonella]|uniref:Uncharacterized protein LOC113515309 n=1 Tax=Galleria mellonella TaxID=7137 RepID=A0A6J1WSV0_GALME|nr:uncharacterized protein LOC113515309 [Galleria mellonella]
MGVLSEINIFPSPDAIHEAGSDIFGFVKYSIDEETVFNEIDISLTGRGTLIVIESVKSGDRQTEHIFRYTEDYIKLNNTIVNNDNVTPVGVYEIPIHFKLATNIPSSLKYNTTIGNYRINCTIAYEVTVTFKRSGFKFDKTLSKPIQVISGIVPRLPRKPVTYGHQKKILILQFFCRWTGLVNIKADIETSVIEPSGKIKLSYIIFNDTNITIKTVQIKLVELYTFSDKISSKLLKYNDVKDTESKTRTIKSGDTQCMEIDIDLPPEKTTIEFSKLVSRNYFVHIIVVLPIPYRNLVLKIPVQIGNEIVNNNGNENPPAYHEAIEIY